MTLDATFLFNHCVLHGKVPSAVLVEGTHHQGWLQSPICPYPITQDLEGPKQEKHGVQKFMFENDVPFPNVGFVSSLKGIHFLIHFDTRKVVQFSPQELPVPLVVRLAIRAHHPPGAATDLPRSCPQENTKSPPPFQTPKGRLINTVDLHEELPAWTFWQLFGFNIRTMTTIFIFSLLQSLSRLSPLASYKNKLDHFMFPKCHLILVAPCFAVQLEDSCFVANHPDQQLSNQPWPQAPNDPTRLIEVNVCFI